MIRCSASFSVKENLKKISFEALVSSKHNCTLAYEFCLSVVWLTLILRGFPWPFSCTYLLRWTTLDMKNHKGKNTPFMRIFLSMFLSLNDFFLPATYLHWEKTKQSLKKCSTYDVLCSESSTGSWLNVECSGSSV